MSKTTITTLQKMKQQGEKITALTAYDYSFARIINQQKIEVILVGDSLGMVIQGHSSTVAVQMDDMIYHSKVVSRACQHSLLITDLPFMSYSSLQQANHNAARLMQEGATEMVKLEGGAQQVKIVAELSRNSIPICAHLGLLPQSVHKIGGYRVQGRAQQQATQIFEDALALQDAGADALVLECVPIALAKKISQSLEIPVIGIGAGRECDGQVLVLHDMLGISEHTPKFTQNFLQAGRTIPEAITAFSQAVKAGDFPRDSHSFI